LHAGCHPAPINGAPEPLAPARIAHGSGDGERDTAGAARYLGLGETAFRRVARTGQIPYTVGAAGGWHFTVAALDGWLKEWAEIQPGDLRHLWDLGD